MSLFNEEEHIRLKAFEWLEEQTRLRGDVLPRQLLEAGFLFGKIRIHLVGVHRIWKPRIFDRIPLSITSAPTDSGPLRFDSDGNLIFQYHGRDPNHFDNVGLRMAFRGITPLIYFFGAEKGRYLPFWPVYVVRDDPQELCCYVDLSARFRLALQQSIGLLASEKEPVTLKEQAVRMVKNRLFQTAFRERVIGAYQCRCAVCDTDQREFLDAVPIVPPKGESGGTVRAGGHKTEAEPDMAGGADGPGGMDIAGGLCLCILHHAAFERNLIGISPEYRVHIRRDFHKVADVPLLKYGLNVLDGQKLKRIPANEAYRPDPVRLQLRYEHFLGDT